MTKHDDLGYTGQRQAGALEETTFKRQQDALREIAHLLEDCRDRLAFNSGNFCERYVNGRMQVALKAPPWGQGQKLVLVFSNDWVGAFGNYFAPLFRGKVLAAAASEDVGLGVEHRHFVEPHSLNGTNRSKFDVLVFPVEIMQSPKKIIPSFVRFKSADHIDSIGGELFSFPPYFTVENLFALSKREVSSFSNNGIFDGEGDREMVKRGTQIVQDFADSNGNIFAGGLKLKYPSFLSRVRIQVFPNRVVASGILGDQLIDALDLGIGAFNLGKSCC